MSQSTSELPEAHGLVALIPRGRNGRRLGLSIGFLFAEDPIRRFGQVPGHCPDGLRVALALGDAVVESTDVAVRLASAHEADRVPGFDERPLEVAVDVPAEPTEAGLSPTGVDPRRRPRIRGQALGGWGTRHCAHLKHDAD